MYVYTNTTTPKQFAWPLFFFKKESNFKPEYLCQISQSLLWDYHFKLKIAAFQSKSWINYFIFIPKKKESANL